MKTALLLLSLLAFAPQDPKTSYALTTTDGDTVTAQVLSVDGDSAKLRVSILGGSMVVTRKLSDFVPASMYMIELTAKAPTDFEGLFAMARRAAELRLLPQAGAAARRAIESVKDPAEQETRRKLVRAWAADALEKMVNEAVKENKLADARHCLKLLTTRLADQRTDEQLDALTATVAALEDRAVADREAARNAKLDAQAREKTSKLFAKVRQDLAKGDKLSREAIGKSRSTVASTNLCEKAIDAYRTAWKNLQEVIEKGGEDPTLAKEASAVSQQLHDNAIRAALHAANMLTVQSDFKGAMEWTTRILKFDPDNAEAKDMVKTIEVAAAAAGNEWGWGWRTVGGGGPVVDPRKS